MVGDRRLTQTSQAASTAPEPVLVDVSEDEHILSRFKSSCSSARSSLDAAGRAGEHENRAGKALAETSEGREQLSDALGRNEVVRRSRSAASRGDEIWIRLDIGSGQAGMRDPPDRADEAGRACLIFDVARVDDQTASAAERSVGESGKSCGRTSQSGGTRPSMTPCASIRPTAPASRCMRAEVALLVAASQREPGHEMVKHELVENDEPSPALERIDDPAVRVWVVSNVVERKVGASRRSPPAAADDA